METVLEVQVRSIYGTDRIYPMNGQAKKVAELLGRKTFTKTDIEKLKQIGFSLKWTPIAYGES